MVIQPICLWDGNQGPHSSTATALFHGTWSEEVDIEDCAPIAHLWQCHLVKKNMKNQIQWKMINNEWRLKNKSYWISLSIWDEKADYCNSQYIRARAHVHGAAPLGAPGPYVILGPRNREGPNYMVTYSISQKMSSLRVSFSNSFFSHIVFRISHKIREPFISTIGTNIYTGPIILGHPVFWLDWWIGSYLIGTHPPVIPTLFFIKYRYFSVPIVMKKNWT